eukprot:570192_1
MDLKQVNQSVVSVILSINDPKNFYSRNHAYSLRFNGKTITNSTGIAFKYQHKIYVICDGNMFAPYIKMHDIELTAQFTDPHVPTPSKYNAQIINMHHLDGLQSGIERMDGKFKFGYLNHSQIHSHLKHKFGFIMLLQLTETNAQLLNHVLSFHALQNASSVIQTPSALIGKSIFSVSNPFGILCSNVLCNTIHHGIISTTMWIQHDLNKYIWLSDMRYLPGMEGAVVISNHQFIGLISLPLMIGNATTLTTIIPAHIILSWTIQQLHRKTNTINIPSVLSQNNAHHLSPINVSNNAPIYNATRSVVPICIGSHWGSALMIYKDHVLTNAHIIRPYLKDMSAMDCVKRVELKETSRYQSPKIGVAISDNNRKWLRCKPIYVTHSESPWDIAWLRVIEEVDQHEQYIHPIELHAHQSVYEMERAYHEMFEQRNNVFVIGYGLIHPWHGLSPIVSHGVLSKVVYDDNKVVILKTSADIHGGHSGGLLCDDRGYCLGILTNNSIFDFDTNKSAMDTWEKQMLWRNETNDKERKTIKDEDKLSFVYPNLNSVIPFSVVYGLYKCIVDGAHGSNVDDRLKEVFQTLDEPNEIIIAKWNLISPEKLEHEVEYDEKMKSIMNRIPQHLLHRKKDLGSGYKSKL